MAIGQRLAGSFIAATLMLTTQQFAAAQRAEVPTGTWEGSVSVGWRVVFDESSGGSTFLATGGGPLIIESIGGGVTGSVSITTFAVLRTREFGVFTGSVDLAAALEGGFDGILFKNVSGSVNIPPAVQAFSGSGGVLTVDSFGCQTISGRLVFPVNGVAAIDAVGTFREIEASWSASRTGDPLLVEELAAVRGLVERIDAVAQAARIDGLAVNRAELSTVIVEAERRVATLSADAVCGAEWTTPIAGAMLALLDAAVTSPEITTTDVEFVIQSALRSGALPTIDGVIEARVAAGLEARLDQAITAGDRVAIDAVFMSAVHLGNRDLGQRALEAM
jgi:hypothetical protein